MKPTKTAQYSQNSLPMTKKKALNEGAAKQIQFMTKNLNVWTTTSSVWISNSYI